MTSQYYQHPPQPPPPGQAQAQAGLGDQSQQSAQDRVIPHVYASPSLNVLTSPQRRYYEALQRAYSPPSGPTTGNVQGMVPVNSLSPLVSPSRPATNAPTNGTNPVGTSSISNFSPQHHQQYSSFHQASLPVQQPSPSASSSQVSLSSYETGPSSTSSVSPQHQGQYNPEAQVQVQQVRKPYTSPYKSGAGVASSQLSVDSNGFGSGSMSSVSPQHHGRNYQQGIQGQQVSPAASGQMFAVGGSGLMGTTSPQNQGQYYQQVQQVLPAAVNGNTNGYGTGPALSSISPQHRQQLYHQVQQASPTASGQTLAVNGYSSGMGTRSIGSISPSRTQQYLQQARQALGPPPAFALSRTNTSSPLNAFSPLNPEQGQYKSLHQQPQAQGTGSVLVGQGSLRAGDDRDVFTDVRAEVDEQAQQLWYWIEVVKLWTFHEAHISTSSASHLATLYISKLPPNLPIHHSDPTATATTAHTSIVSTLLSESLSLLRHLTLTVLFPLVHKWTSSPQYHIHMSQSQSLAKSLTYSHTHTQTRSRSRSRTAQLQSQPLPSYPTDTRSHRLAFWRDKALERTAFASDFPDGSTDLSTPLEKFTEVLETILDRRWVYGGDGNGGAGDGGDGGKMSRAMMRAKMKGYFMWKFVLSADVVFLELVRRLVSAGGGEAYCAERWREVYFPAMIPQLAAINQDPLIIPYLVRPDDWPCTMSIDEHVLNRCVAVIAAGPRYP
ncbi:hypothetical protein ONS96_013290 [Cadophora gregata f. sp. sojae]|nr:hypothetical protein ONS96_013290 [Cadophora gregata f. sp. sojae]